MAHSTHGRVIWRPTRFAIYCRDDWRCLACGKRGIWRPGRRGNLELDHVVPGRGSNPTNIVSLCTSCNGSKNDRPLAEWRADLVDVVAIQLATPIDPELGRAFAWVLCPAWMRQQQERPGRVRALRHMRAQTGGGNGYAAAAVLT